LLVVGAPGGRGDGYRGGGELKRADVTCRVAMAIAL
jgi:hypothetical protein